MKKTAFTLFLLPQFEKFIAASKKGKRLKYPGKKVTKGTLLQYQYVQKLLEEFELKQSESIRIQFLKKQSLGLINKEKRYWNNFFHSFTAFLYKDKYCYDNYVNSVCKILKAFFNYLSEEKNYPIGNFHKQFKIPSQNFTPLVLEPGKLQFLITNQVFEDSLPKSLKRTKDIFVFGCTVALRYSDLMNLKKEHLICTPDGKYLQIHTQKTSSLVKLPLPDYLLKILERHYNKNGKYLLPRLSSTNLNLQVIELCKRAGWDYNLPKVRYKMGRPIELKNKEGKSLKYYEQVTTHTMRRTAITTLLIMGVPELMVKRISGHTAHSKEFYRYVVMVQDYLDKQVLQAYEKLVLIA